MSLFSELESEVDESNESLSEPDSVSELSVCLCLDRSCEKGVDCFEVAAAGGALRAVPEAAS
ncbi:MAG: hypothetical protein QXI19_02420 [Candidatus Caldarchaeum sp.]